MLSRNHRIAAVRKLGSIFMDQCRFSGQSDQTLVQNKILKELEGPNFKNGYLLQSTCSLLP
jgi:hypothetical protein